MGKTLLYLLILCVLGFSVYFFVFRRADDSSYDMKEAGFTVKDTANVGKIFIANNYNESILIEKTGLGWSLNKQYTASPMMVKMILSTLNKQYALYPVTKNAFDNAVKVLMTDGIKVEVYDNKGAKMKVFYVGGASVNGNGTNMMMEGAKTPYIVQEQGFAGVLTPRYNCEVNAWRDKTVFNIRPDDIKDISVRYYENPLNSFTVTHDGNNVTVKGDPKVTTMMDSMNKHRATSYITYFEHVYCEGYLNGALDLPGSITEKQRYLSIDVNDIKGQDHHIDIFWMPVNKRSKNTATSNSDVPDEYDSDRMYAVMNNNKDTVLIQRQSFIKILRKAFEFYQKDAK